MAIRFDRGKLSKAKRTAQGYARVDGRLTRTGILEYTRADGSVQREYRPAEEVFKADSLASLAQAPVTDLHPPTMLTTTNTRKYASGVCAGSGRQDGTFVAAELVVQDATLIAKIDSGERCEVSCGYACDLDATPGEFEGQHYDAVQRNIVYNHVAIGPRDWGRAGTDVALRLDSAGDMLSRFDSDKSVTENGIIPQGITMKIGQFEIKVDARDEEIVKAELAARAEKLDVAEKKVAELNAAAGKAAAEQAAMKTRCDAAEARAAKIDRADLEREASQALGAEFKFDGKSDADVRTAVVAKMLPSVKLDGKDAAFVGGCYAAALDLAAKSTEQLKKASEQSAPGARTDAKDENDPAKAREKMIAERRDAWKTPAGK